VRSREFIPDLWPVVQRCGIEIRTVWPYECPGLGIERNPVEPCRIQEGTEERPAENRLEIDALLAAVAEADRERIRSDDAEPVSR
jgi:hypothetical protein